MQATIEVVINCWLQAVCEAKPSQHIYHNEPNTSCTSYQTETHCPEGVDVCQDICIQPQPFPLTDKQFPNAQYYDF